MPVSKGPCARYRLLTQLRLILTWRTMVLECLLAKPHVLLRKLCRIRNEISTVSKTCCMLQMPVTHSRVTCVSEVSSGRCEIAFFSPPVSDILLSHTVSKVKQRRYSLFACATTQPQHVLTLYSLECFSDGFQIPRSTSLRAFLDLFLYVKRAAESHSWVGDAL